MREVRMKTLAAGPDGVVSPGQVAKLSDEQAAARVDGGFAQYEKAMVEVPEKRTTPKKAAAPKKAAKKAVKK